MEYRNTHLPFDTTRPLGVSRTVRRLLLLCLLLGFATLGQPATAEVRPSSSGIRADLQMIVQQQLAAFRVDDYATAYGFAHPNIKRLYSAAKFETMVRREFPRIARSANAEFADAVDDGDKAAVAVTVTGADGLKTEYHYLLEKVSGEWKISAVIPTSDESVVEV